MSKICAYSHCECFHNSKEIPVGEEVKVGLLYYHADCNNQRIAENRIVDIWTNSVDPNPIMKQLRGVMKKILDNPSMTAEKLEYHLLWCLSHGWNIKRPGGLYYVAKCEEADAAWNKHYKPKPKFTDEDFKAMETTQADDFVYRPQATGFNRITGKHP